MARRRGARVRTLLVAVALVAAACGNSGSDESDTADDGDGDTAADLPADMGASERDTNEAVDAPGVSDTEIRFRSISTITGNPLGTDIGNAYNDGIEAYFAWRNSEGGIYGRDLVLEAVDDQLGSNAARAEELVAVDDAFGAFVATLLFTGAPVLDEGGVPTFGWGIHAEFSGRRNLFGHNAPICARVHAADVAVPGGAGGRLEGRRARLQHVRCVEAVRPGPARLVRAVRAGRRRPGRSCSTTTTCRSGCPAASGRRWRT